MSSGVASPSSWWERRCEHNSAMGDKVERALEETVPLLRQVRRLKLLNESEISQLVQIRRDHEYALMRPAASRAEFMRYAAFERETAELFHERARAKELPEKRALSIASQQASRVNLVYSRAIRKFKGDDGLYLHYARHCIKTGSRKGAEKVLAKAIAHRGDSEKVWMAAAAFHFDSCGDIKVARTISQRGLRALKTSKPLWKEYFRLELAYLAKLVAKRTTVGMVPAELHAEASQAESRVGEAQQLGGSSRNGDESKREIGGAREEGVQKLDFWNGGVPFAVFRSALSTAHLCPSDAAEYIRVATSMPFSPSGLMRALAQSSREKFDYKACPILYAKLLCVPFDAASAGLRMKRSAVEAARNIGTAAGGEAPDNSPTEAMQIEAVRKAAVNALTEFELSTSLLRGEESDQRSVLGTLSRFEEAVKEALGPTVHDELRPRFLSVEKLICGSGCDVADDCSGGVSPSIEDLKREQLASKWATFLQGPKVMDLVEANDGADICAIRSALEETSAAVPFRNAEQERICLEWFRWESDIAQLRRAYAVALSVPPVTMILTKSAIEAEIRLGGEILTEESVDSIRKLFGRASDLGEAANDVDFWLHYLRFERGSARDASRAATVQWKANHTLAKGLRSSFREQCVLMNML